MPKKPSAKHRVERTRNKHSRAVIHNGTIVIRLARGLTWSQEREHVEDLLSRMEEQMEDENRKTLIDPFGRLLGSGETGTVSLANDRKYRYILKPGKRTMIRRKDYWTFCVTVAPRLRRSSLHRLLWKALCMAERARIETLVHQINRETLGVHVNGVKLRFASSQWGSCSPRGVIMLNAALLFTDTEVLRYVIIHELAHRKRCDHSPKYWAWVQWAMPRFKVARAKLHDYRLPSL